MPRAHKGVAKGNSGSKSATHNAQGARDRGSGAAKIGGTSRTRGGQRHKIGNQAAQRLGMSKSGDATLGRHTDPVEKRASAMAARAGPCGCTGTCSKCASKGNGGLSPSAQHHYETAYGADLSGVKIHKGPAADAATHALGTAGFALNGQVTLSSKAGPNVLGHELAHVAMGDDRGTIRRDPPTGETDSAGADAALDADVDAEKNDPPASETTAHLQNTDGVFVATLSDDNAHTRRVLARLIGDRGLAVVGGLVNDLETRARSHHATDGEVTTAPVARIQFDLLEQDWNRFSLRVRTLAAMRLEYNIQSLAQWTAYVQTMPASRIKHEVMAQNVHTLVQQVADRPNVGPYWMWDKVDEWTHETSPGERAHIEMLAAGKINGGCMDCHVRKEIPRFDRQFHADSDVFRTPLTRMQEAAGIEDMRGGWRNPIIDGELIQGARANEEMRAGAEGRPGLTGVLDAADSIAPTMGALQRAVTGQESHEQRPAEGFGDLVRQLMTANAVPQGVFNAELSGDDLRANALAAIASRSNQMADFKTRVQQPDYDFLQLTPMVQAMIGSADADTRIMIRTAQESAASDVVTRFLVELGLSVAALLLTIYPPTTAFGIGLGLGLAVSQFEQGMTSYRQGTDIIAGSGAGVFSPEQEQAAGQMVAMGAMSMLLSVVDVGSSAFGVARAFRAAPSAPPGTAMATRNAAAGSAPPGRLNAIWYMESYDEVSGMMVVWGKNLAADGSGEIAKMTVNVRTQTVVGDVFGGPNAGRYVHQNGAWDTPPPALAAQTDVPGAAPTGSTALVPTGPGTRAPAPDIPGPAQLTHGPRTSLPGTATSPDTSGLPPGSVFMPGGGVWLRGNSPHFTPPPRPVAGMLGETSSAGNMPDGFVIGGVVPSETMRGLQPWQLPSPGDRYWHFSGGNWYLYKHMDDAAPVAQMYEFLGPNGEYSAILDIPGRHRSAQISTTGQNTGVTRAYAPGLNSTEFMDGYARSHVIPLADSTPNAATGVQSTRHIQNYVAHDIRYNGWLRNNLEKQIRNRGNSWYSIQELTGQTNRAGLPIAASETIVEINPATGNAVRAWNFDTRQGAWENVATGTLGSPSEVNTVFGPIGPGSSQIPLSALPPRNVGNRQ